MELKRSVAYNPPDAIQMKGTGYGIRMTLPESPPEAELLEILQNIPPQAYLFPVGEGVVLDLQGRACSEELLFKILQTVIWPGKIRVLAWLTTDRATWDRLYRAGLRTDEPSSALSPSASVLADCPEVLLLYNSLRSGQNIEARGDVVLWGHLNVGAEILASGSVTVVGKLKGVVHAGKEGRDDVYVLAGSFEAPQVRVGRKLCYSDASMSWWQKTVLISLEGDRLIVREGQFVGGPH